MMLTKGRYTARFAQTAGEIEDAQKLRHMAFGLKTASGLDSDKYDDLCKHIIITDGKSGGVVCCYRLLHLANGSHIDQSYSAQFYNLTPLKQFAGSIVEIGRFCLHPDAHDADILRVAWAALTSYVDENKIELLFGCASFSGTDQAPYLDSFAMLRDRHLAPKRWLPRVKSKHVFRFAAQLRIKPDVGKALRHMPPLLRTYLMMGGWVSDHAVVDAKMNTLHVFTGVEINLIPAARKRLLRALT